MIESIIEIFTFDPLIWHKWNFKKAFKKDVTPERSDKPWSTRVWIALVIITGIMIEYAIVDNWALSYAFLAFTFRVAFFDYICNFSKIGKHRQPFFYLGPNKLLEKVKYNHQSKRWLHKIITVYTWKWKLNGYPRLFIEIVIFITGALQYLYLAGYLTGNKIIFDIPIFPK